MELVTAVKGRRSIRKYKQVDVPQNLIAELLSEARWSPSWGNTQPWEFYVLTGERLARYKEMNLEKQAAGDAPAPDVIMPSAWPAPLKARYEETIGTLLTAQGIKREDKAARNKYYQEMGSLFGAPCLILACISRNSVVEYAMLDVGLIAQTICLLAHDKELGTCILASAVLYPAAIREIASIPDDKRIIAGITLGYPDPAFPLNQFDRKRAEISEFVHWVK
jgi:nitroreductase